MGSRNWFRANYDRSIDRSRLPCCSSMRLASLGETESGSAGTQLDNSYLLSENAWNTTFGPVRYSRSGSMGPHCPCDAYAEISRQGETNMRAARPIATGSVRIRRSRSTSPSPRATISFGGLLDKKSRRRLNSMLVSSVDATATVLLNAPHVECRPCRNRSLSPSGLKTSSKGMRMQRARRGRRGRCGPQRV